MQFPKKNLLFFYLFSSDYRGYNKGTAREKTKNKSSLTPQQAETDELPAIIERG